MKRKIVGIIVCMLLIVAIVFPVAGNTNECNLSIEENLKYTDFKISNEAVSFQLGIVVGPYTQNVTDTSLTIIWETDNPTSDNRVEYGETSSYGYIEYGKSDTDHHEITIHPTFASGHYKVVSDSVESEDFRFKLASHPDFYDEFEFVIFGDSRGVWDNWQMATIMANAVHDESSEFVIHLGDMVHDGWQDTEWMSWLSLMKPLMQDAPVYGVLGNHELNAPRYFEIFAHQNNEKWYSFDYGLIHFTVLSNYHQWNVGSEQYQWLENDLSTTTQPVKFVCFHEPIYCAEGQWGHPPREDIREVWEPLFINYNVKLVWQGHNHFYQRTDPLDGVIYLVSGGAGAPVTPPGDDWYINFSLGAFHYCLLDVSIEDWEIIISARDKNGETFDEFIISIPKPEVYCEGELRWENVGPGVTVNGSFTVENVGDPQSMLNWNIKDWPKDWGTDWTLTPMNGSNLSPGDGPVTVDVTVVTPSKKGSYTGTITIENIYDSKDYDTIKVVCKVPKNKALNIKPLILRFLDQHPNMFPIIRQLMEL
jgi:hypothetical protein